MNDIRLLNVRKDDGAWFLNLTSDSDPEVKEPFGSIFVAVNHPRQVLYMANGGGFYSDEMLEKLARIIQCAQKNLDGLIAGTISPYWIVCAASNTVLMELDYTCVNVGPTPKPEISCGSCEHYEAEGDWCCLRHVMTSINNTCLDWKEPK